VISRTYWPISSGSNDDLREDSRENASKSCSGEKENSKAKTGRDDEQIAVRMVKSKVFLIIVSDGVR